MKQKELTDIQKSLLENLESVLKEAARLNIRFIYDLDDRSVTAYNGENIHDTSTAMEHDNDEPINWDKTLTFFQFYMDFVDTRYHELYLHFK